MIHLTHTTKTQNGTQKLGLLYGKHKIGKLHDIYGYVDADWAGSSFDRRSTSVTVSILAGIL